MTWEGSGIGGRLRAARERLGWSREELAFHADLSWSAIAQVESGRRRNLRPRTLTNLAGALGVSIDYLVNGGPTPAMLTHHALLYEDREEFAESAGRFLLDAIHRSEAALAVTDKRNLKVLEERLGADAKRAELWDSKLLTSPEAAVAVFTEFMTAKLRDGAVWVRIVGEPVWKGRSEADVRLWTKYESLLNLKFAGSPASALCPYDVSALDPAIVRDAHLTHSHTIQRGEAVESSEYREPAGFVLEP
jgi:transcriptional regulator with XRE-family HTH domain